MNNMFSMFNTFNMFGNTKKKYNPYINYTWEMLPNAKVKNSGTSGVDLQLYSGNPLDFQATQGIQVNKSFTLSGNAISLYLGFDTDSIAITHTLAEFDNLKVSIVNAILRVTINAVNHDVATLVKDTYYQTEIVINSNNLTVKLNGTQTYSASCTALNTTILKSLGANDGLASGRFDGQFDYFIAYNGLTTFSLSNQFFKDMSTNSNTLFATDFRGIGSTIKDYKSNAEYPITNYSATQRTNFLQESKGLQDLTRSFDSNGFFVDNTDYLNCNGKGYGDTGWIPSDVEDWSIETIIDKHSDGEYRLMGISNSNGESIGLGYFVNGNAMITLDGYRILTTTLPINLFCITKTFDEIKFYLNGMLIASYLNTYKASSKSFYISGRNGEVGRKLNKPCRLFKVHDKALTQEEITKNYNDYVAKGLLQ